MLIDNPKRYDLLHSKRRWNFNNNKLLTKSCVRNPIQKVAYPRRPNFHRQLAVHRQNGNRHPQQYRTFSCHLRSPLWHNWKKNSQRKRESRTETASGYKFVTNSLLSTISRTNCNLSIDPRPKDYFNCTQSSTFLFGSSMSLLGWLSYVHKCECLVTGLKISVFDCCVTGYSCYMR